MAATDNLSAEQFAGSEDDMPKELQGADYDYYANPDISMRHGGNGDAKLTISARARMPYGNDDIIPADSDFTLQDMPAGAPKYDKTLVEAGLRGTDIWNRNLK